MLVMVLDELFLLMVEEGILLLAVMMNKMVKILVLVDSSAVDELSDSEVVGKVVELLDSIRELVKL